MLLKFWLSGQINLLLHPGYVWLAYSAAFFLLALGALKVIHIVGRSLIRARRGSARTRTETPAPPHYSLFPPGWGSAVLLAVAIFGLQFTPQPFASQMALDRGVTDTLTLTRAKPQSFRASSRPEDRTLTEWVRTLNVYPEPDAYTGQKAQVDGFVMHLKDYPDNYLTIARFVITCCAADVYPIGLPVKIKESRSTYPADKWFRVEGRMITETVAGKRQLVIEASKLTEIPKPAVPYEY